MHNKNIYVKMQRGKVCEYGNKHVYVHPTGEVSENIFNGQDVVIVVNLQNILDEVPDRLSAVAHEAIRKVGYDSKFLHKTVEGQELLEYIVAEYTEWDESLSIHTPGWYREDDEIYYNLDEQALASKDDWATDDYQAHSLQPTKEFLNLVDTPSDCYTYILKFIDGDDLSKFYVGKSTDIINRLNRHLRNDGDFSYANRNSVVLLELHDLFSEDRERSEYKKYISKYGEDRVYGGR